RVRDRDLAAHPGARRYRGSALQNALVLAQNPRLHHAAGLLFYRVGHVLELTVLLAPAGHADEQAVLAVDDLDVVDHEAAVEHDRDEGLQLLFLHREHFDFSDFHVSSPSSEAAPGADRFPSQRSGAQESSTGRQVRSRLSGFRPASDQTGAAARQTNRFEASPQERSIHPLDAAKSPEYRILQIIPELRRGAA